MEIIPIHKSAVFPDEPLREYYIRETCRNERVHIIFMLVVMIILLIVFGIGFLRRYRRMMVMKKYYK